MDISVIFLTIIYVVIALIAYYFRTKKNIEIKTSELTVAFVPIFIILLLSGTITEFDFFGIKAKLRNTVETKISNSDYELIPTERLTEAEKGGTAMISMYLQKNPEALSFKMGKEYYTEIIDEYINRIPSLTFILIKNESDEFIGLMEISNYRKMNSKEKLIDGIRDKNYTKLNELRPKLITREKALTTDNTRKDALNYFSNNTTMILPVINMERKTFEGILRREVLTSGLLQTIFEKIE